MLLAQDEVNKDIDSIDFYTQEESFSVSYNKYYFTVKPTDNHYILYVEDLHKLSTNEATVKIFKSESLSKIYDLIATFIRQVQV